MLKKKKNIRTLDNLRPISLLGPIYKLISKAINRRLINSTSQYISSEQAAFRKGWSTVDYLANGSKPDSMVWRYRTGGWRKEVKSPNDVAEAEANLEKVEKKLREMGLELNKKKTKWMGSTGIDRDQSLGLGGESIERVAAFIYLGSEISFPRNPESEVGARARMAWSTF
ncbi:unnamed protein product [Bursaphelenchus okinawaensis]|uniref:Reverse transcriptase domain-containing protein n=1 Tax=Bursaphelenchus okinawaensis TaxID=465554 RepID=A0A811LLC7_9BILA|nr:unnamed protein product [Bursaphelenchus okinawaensis]CAG9123550.1 unnamed protein product [Bursaphelenchus okinawaensis]